MNVWLAWKIPKNVKTLKNHAKMYIDLYKQIENAYMANT